MAWVDFTAPGSPIERRMKWDEVDDALVIESTQDVGEALAFNRAWANADRPTSTLWHGRDYVKVASVPLIQIERWWKEGLNFFDPNDAPRILRLLNDSDYGDFRTAPGRL